MFIDRLNEEQRQALFDLAVMMAAADNDVSEEEIEYLQELSQKYGIVFDLNKSLLKMSELLVKMDSNEAKIITLQELMRISYKDGHFSPDERDKVFVIAQKMGVNDPALLLAVEKWVRQGFDWLYEGEQLLDYKF
ncbi:TerB family tellurite resistance protein [Thiomicrospira microaerophila]|uniref:TerB family tellurite resistance protein n=1 Tax=Thiomicrospira microaerophila TaxID=406020 RepID=UPI00200F5162|nr:TerB family tellurite resistance protein [Thiomicrospira microaerophila]UQB41833.1 TerB family tellurite resistance protein [Thiomicrospira microaerophila]